MNTKPKAGKNQTKSGKRLGRPPKLAAALGSPAPSPATARIGRPKKEALTTLEIVQSELGKRPGYAEQLSKELASADQPAGKRVVRTVASTKRQLARIRKRRRELTGVDWGKD